MLEAPLVVHAGDEEPSLSSDDNNGEAEAILEDDLFVA
jgi:hypothetical protein